VDIPNNNAPSAPHPHHLEMTSVYALRARQLFVVFCAWKALLLSVAAFSPGPGYDTSALILVDASNRRHANHLTSSRPSRLGLNLFRWDALYFVKAAERGIVYEQEWAFSPTYSRLLYFACQCKRASTLSWIRTDRRTVFSGRSDCSMRCYVVAGIVISNICHFLSVLVLYRLLTIVLGRQQQRQIPFVASILHILTPASLFLSAPYAEAMFSLLNLGGMLLYAQSRAPGDNRPSIWEDAYKLCAGLLFGLATMVRSNGLLSGLILLYDVARYSPQLISMRLSVHDLRRIIVTCVSGTFVAAGFVLPQILAYTKFCNQDVSLEARPWCEKSIPSIYSWVQSHYW
jgi:phosphatidylinositol glycan class V